MKVTKCPIDMYKEDHNGSSIDVSKVDMVHQGNSEKKKKKENKENVESCSQESEDYFKVDSYGEVKWVTK